MPTGVERMKKKRFCVGDDANGIGVEYLNITCVGTGCHVSESSILPWVVIGKSVL